jgi:LacI family transcriptional regulator
MMQKKAPTLKDVAERAGVSKMAVSTVLNDRKSTVGVSDATRQRILEALAELQYMPHAMARSLKRQRTDSVGFFNGYGHVDAREPFIREIFQGVHEGLVTYSRDMLLYNGLSMQPHRVVLDRLLGNKVDGVIVLPSADDERLVKDLCAMDRPAVVVGDTYPGLPCVTASDVDGSAELARYLVERGHRRILYRRASRELTYEGRRWNAFCMTATSLGADVIGSRAADGMETIPETDEQLILNRRAKDGITAIACWRDYSAVRVLNFCRLNGIRVPEDIAVAGFDGLSYPNQPAYTLTTVAANWYHVARTAADLIVSRIDGVHVADETIIPSSLRVGNTA